MTSGPPDHPIAQERRTSLWRYVTAKEAYDMWQADLDLKILGCRTPEEYVFVGHPPMAVNIPFAFQSFEWDAERQGFRRDLNPEFMSAVTRWARTDETILVSCRSGGRAAMAIEVMAKAGFTKAYNLLDGMEGAQGQGSRKRLRWHAHEERLEELRTALDVRARSRTAR